MGTSNSGSGGDPHKFCKNVSTVRIKNQVRWPEKTHWTLLPDKGRI